MVQIPDASLIDRVSPRSGRALVSGPSVNTGTGLQELGSDLGQASVNLEDAAKRQTALDGVAADGNASKDLNDFERTFDTRTDYGDFGSSFNDGAREIRDRYASQIADPRARQIWVDNFNKRALSSRSRILDRGVAGQRDERIAGAKSGLEGYQSVIADTGASEEARAEARKNADASIAALQTHGDLSAQEAETWRKNVIEGGDFVYGQRQIEADPSVLVGKTGPLADRIIGIESGGNANAKNPNSSASGAGQFLDSTWLAMVKKYRPDLADGKSASQILALKGDKSLAREMVGAYAKENGNFLTNEGLQPTDGNVYLAHFLGPRGAAQVLKADPNTPVANIVGQDVVNANPFLKGMSASQVAAWADKKMGGKLPDWYTSQPADRQLQLEQMAQRRQLAIDQEKNAAFKAQQDSANDDYRLRIATGDPNLTNQEILQDGRLDNGHKATLIDSLNKQNGDSADVSAFLSSLRSGSPDAKLNAFDDADRSLGDKAYKAIDDASPEDKKQAVAESFVAQTGYIPKQVTAGVRQNLNAQTPAEVASGMEEAARLYQIAPSAFDAVPNGDDMKKAALAYQTYTASRGLSSEQAAQRWMAMNAPEMVEKRERLKKPAQDFLKTLSVSDVTSALDTSILPFSSPSAGLTQDQQAAVMTDYSKIAEEKFLQTGGDADLAKKMALQDMTKLYGVSKVSGGGVVTKFPPEHYYPPIAGSQDYIRDAALKDAQDYLGGSEEQRLHLGAYERNKRWVKPGLTSADFTTKLSPQDETKFEAWVKQNNVPFDPNAKGPQDYDMRGFWKGLESGDPHAQTGVDPNDGKLHFTDYWKTPYHESFSRESKFATSSAPDWNAQDQLVGTDGTVYFDDRNQSANRQSLVKLAPSGDAVQNVSLVPTKETADDIRLGQPPRYRLMFQRQDGVWDAVPGQLFSVSPDEMKSLMQADSKKRLDAAKAVHQQFLDEQAASDKALNTTVGPDWMKARAAEAARERQKMDAGGAQMNQDNGKLGQEFLKGMSETIANPPPF